MGALDEAPGVVIREGFVRGAVEEDAVEAVAVGGVFVDVVPVGFRGAAAGRGVADVGDVFAGAVAEGVVAVFGLAATGCGDGAEALEAVISGRWWWRYRQGWRG